MELSIVIPVYNEGNNIKNTVKGIENNINFRHELLLIYDFDKDTTIKPANELKKIYPSVVLVKNKYNKGALNAIKTGMEVSKGQAVIVTMADCSDDPKTIPYMLREFLKGADIVCGSRYMKGGQKIGGNGLKSFLSYLAGVSGWFLLGLPTHDLTNSFKLYRNNLLKKIKIESIGGFELGMEILVKGYFTYKAKVVEVPTIWHDRTEGKSQFKLLSWLPSYIHWYLWALKEKFLHF